MGRFMGGVRILDMCWYVRLHWRGNTTAPGHSIMPTPTNNAPELANNPDPGRGGRCVGNAHG
jgi:hypothetical protein